MILTVNLGGPQHRTGGSGINIVDGHGLVTGLYLGVFPLNETRDDE